MVSANVFKKPVRLVALTAMACTLSVMAQLGYAQPATPSLKQEQAGYKTPSYSAGVQAYRQGSYKSAAGYFRQALAKDMTNANAHYYLGLTLDKLGQPIEAATEYGYVASQSREPELVAYAKNRLGILQPIASALVAPPASGALALMTAGSQMAAKPYRGAVSQVAVPLKNSKNALVVDALLRQGNTQTGGAFIIDTGATYTSISQEMADELGLDLSNCETVLITTANGRIEVPKVIIQNLNVNGLEAHNIEATVIPVRKGASFSGLLGLSFIRQFVVTIDPQANQLIFRRN